MKLSNLFKKDGKEAEKSTAVKWKVYMNSNFVYAEPLERRLELSCLSRIVWVKGKDEISISSIKISPLGSDLFRRALGKEMVLKIALEVLKEANRGFESKLEPNADEHDIWFCCRFKLSELNVKEISECFRTLAWAHEKLMNRLKEALRK